MGGRSKLPTPLQPRRGFPVQPLRGRQQPRRPGAQRMALLLALNPILTNLLVVLFLFVCVVLILTILIQRPAGGGLSGAFGSGAGSGQTAFGAKTGDALTI